MSKNHVRIFGAVLMIIGFLLPFIFDNNVVDLITGILIGLGIVLIITGRIKSEKSNSEKNSQENTKNVWILLFKIF